MAFFYVLCYNKQNSNEANTMSTITLGREMYYIADQIAQKEIPSDDVLLTRLQETLNGRDCFMICGKSFDLLHQLGFVETCKYDAEYATPVYYVDVIAKSVMDREHVVHPYERLFQKVDGNRVTELYFKREDFAFKEDHNDYFYNLVLKGSYLKDSLPEGKIEYKNMREIKFPKLSTPSIIGYKQNGDISVTCTVTKNRVIWFFNGDHAYQDDVIYKEYESNNLFDIAIVNYTHKKRIESIVFRLGNRQVDIEQVADVVPALVGLKPIEQLNWERYVTPEQILVLEMRAI
jgi:hypothetical protein